MIEESYVRMYASDFVNLAAKAEQGHSVDAALQKRIEDCRSHALVMDRHKGEGHLQALIGRLHDESVRFSGRGVPRGEDIEPAAARHRIFITDIAHTLAASVNKTAELEVQGAGTR